MRSPCRDKTEVKKGTWSPQEDQILKAYVEKHGPGNWRNLPKLAGLERCGKSCRFRWMNYLRPDIKRGNYTKFEEEVIINLHAKYGNRWSLIAAGLPGRTDNEIKNVWHTHLQKRQKKIETVHDLHRVDAKDKYCSTPILLDGNDQQLINLADDSSAMINNMLMHDDQKINCHLVDDFNNMINLEDDQLPIQELHSILPLDDQLEDLMDFWFNVLMEPSEVYL